MRDSHGVMCQLSHDKNTHDRTQRGGGKGRGGREEGGVIRRSTRRGNVHVMYMQYMHDDTMDGVKGEGSGAVK